jgi:hypothetical protein
MEKINAEKMFQVCSKNNYKICEPEPITDHYTGEVIGFVYELIEPDTHNFVDCFYMDAAQSELYELLVKLEEKETENLLLKKTLKQYKTLVHCLQITINSLRGDILD